MNDEKLRLLLSYPDRGWAVFPCFPRQKTPATPNGFHDAVTEKDQITKWYKNNPDYNWGLVTGKQSGLLVIDLDAKGDGLKGWNNLVAANGLSEPTVTVQTGGGGTHLWFALPEKLKINRKIRWKPGIDVLGDGGYILVPPSQTLKLYEFEVHPDEVELAPLPDWLLECVS